MLSILRFPHSCLRRKCAPVPKVDDEVRRLAKAMKEAMVAANGIGLAAPQVGRAVRVLVADVSPNRSHTICLANPEIVYRAGDIALEEGCLSVPGVAARVPRAFSVAVRGVNMAGREEVVEASELLAVCLQHEIDHLDGVLFFDHLSSLKRGRLLEKYRRAREE